MGSIRRQIRNASSLQNLPRSQVAVSVIVLVWHHYVSSFTLHLASAQVYICTILTCHLTASAEVLRQHNEFRSVIHATHRYNAHRDITQGTDVIHRWTYYAQGHNAQRRAVYFLEHRQLRIRTSHEGVPGGAKVHRLIVTKTINLSSSL